MPFFFMLINPCWRLWGKEENGKMVAKGKSDFQAIVDDSVDSLKMMISLVSREINAIRAQIESNNSEIVEKVQIWDEEAKKYVLEEWHPYLDTAVLDEMSMAFYASMLQRIYSFCEIGLVILTKNVGIAPGQLKKSKKNKGDSKIKQYYEVLQRKSKGSLCAIEDIWKNYSTFHYDRNIITHEELLLKINTDYLNTNIDEIRELLLYLENKLKSLMIIK